MKRTILIVLGAFTISAGAYAQMRGRGEAPPPPPPLEPGASQVEVDKALIAAPPGRLRDQATVVKWNNKDFTYTTLRKGTNRLVCYDRSGFALQQPFSVQCTSIANLDRVAQNLKAEATGDRKQSEAMLDEMDKNGTRVKPEFGSVWYTRAGPDQEHARPEDHITIAVPGATTQSMGLPDNPQKGGVWIMNAGTQKAHLMVPGQ